MDRGSVWKKVRKALEDFALGFCVALLGLVGGVGAVVLFFERRERWRKRGRGK
jgi:hypothetical protein